MGPQSLVNTICIVVYKSFDKLHMQPNDQFSRQPSSVLHQTRTTYLLAGYCIHEMGDTALFVLLSYSNSAHYSHGSPFPASSFKLLVPPFLFYVIGLVVFPQWDNIWARLLWISNRLPDTPEGHRAYAKSYWVSNARPISN